jgi:RNA polymerase sigma-70 factor (ECF subfamily)
MIERLDNVRKIESFQQLLRDCDQSVLRLALRVTGSEQDAASIYRETFMTLYGEFESSRSDTSLGLSAYRIAAGLCLDYLRKRQRLVSYPTPVLDKLSPRERVVLELKHYHGLNLQAVSKVLDTTEETAKDILLRATQKLHWNASVNYEQNSSH